MKKQKRFSPDAQTPDPMRDLEINFGSSDIDSDIIELEDIIEMPAGPIDEDEDLDLDAEIFDMEMEPSGEQEQLEQPVIEEQARQVDYDQEDLLKSLEEDPEEGGSLFDDISLEEPETTPGEKSEAELFDMEDESLLDDLLDEPAEAGEKESSVLKERAAAALKIPEEDRYSELEQEPLIPEEQHDSGQSLTSAELSEPPQADHSKMAEELVNQIESRLQERIKETVEAMLPELVRTAISEEIEKLKKEM